MGRSPLLPALRLDGKEAAVNVYVVAFGEHAEGHDPERAFSNLDGARDWIRQRWQIEVRSTGPGKGIWTGHLDNRVDEVRIHRMRVWDR